ncbi:MAG: D-aminoacyl-tRNA deacylase [Candidatus Hydrogenedentes bacterium]|nr:D-aminoacyl-tRNA deacylase [Candidatus Hydrogenedentota bacterium]
MRAVVQRVRHSSVTVDDVVVGKIGLGLMVLLGIDLEDEEKDAAYMADKIVGLRIFNDYDDKFNLSLLDVGGSVLLVSQFTLHGDCRKGRRPSFVKAARPEKAAPLYERVGELLRDKGVTVANGVFGVHMDVALVNDGPVTLLLDSGTAL